MHIEIQLGPLVWWMTTKKAAKTTFFCEGVHTGRNPWICMRDGINYGKKLVSELKFTRKSSIYVPESV